MTDHTIVAMLLLFVTAQCYYWFAHREDQLSFFIMVFFVFLTNGFVLLTILSAMWSP